MSDFKFKYTLIAILIVIITLLLGQLPILKSAISSLGAWGYLGAFFSGVFFVSFFTVAPATLALYFLATYLNPIEIALLAGGGAVVGDYLIFKFVKDRVFEELSPLFEKFFKSSFFKKNNIIMHWLLVLLGALIILSPFPDEVGIGLLGVSKMKSWQFVILSFALNSVGIYLIVIAAMALS